MQAGAEGPGEGRAGREGPGLGTVSSERSGEGWAEGKGTIGSKGLGEGWQGTWMGPVQRLEIKVVCGWKRGLKGAWPVPQAAGIPSPIQGLTWAWLRHPSPRTLFSSPPRFFRPREDGKARKERGGKHKMEEVRPSNLVLMLICPASLAESLWGSPEPHRGSSTASPAPEGCLALPTPLHTLPSGLDPSSREKVSCSYCSKLS